MDSRDETKGPRFEGARRVVACIVSLVSPGAGHFLLGRNRRGVAWAVGTSVIGLGLLFILPVSLWALVGVIAFGIVTRLVCVIDAALMPAGRTSWKVVLIAWAAIAVGGSAIDAPLRAYSRAHGAQGFTISSAGMEPTLLVGDYVLTDNSVYRGQAPRRGDIIVFKYPEDERRDFVKRIVGMPGDQLLLRGHEVYIGGTLLAEPYLKGGGVPSTGRCAVAYGCDPFTVPAGSYFVMGDDRGNSQDSRHWGVVKRGKIVGRVFVIYWSWDGSLHYLRHDRIGRAL
jgi:signal peptidase I